MGHRHQRPTRGGTHQGPALTFRAAPMTRKPLYLFLTALVALAALFVSRQRALNALGAGNSLLRREVDLEQAARSAAVRETSANTTAELSKADEKELLQLRSKIQPLREQLRDTSNLVVILQKLGTGGVSPGHPPPR